MSIVKKSKQNLESEIPDNSPYNVESTTQKAEKIYHKYKDIAFYMELESYSETLKISGVPWQAEFDNIRDYHNNYKDRLPEKYDPYTEIGIGIFSETYGSYIFGCRVNSFDNLPEGITGVDTGVKNFAVITFKAENTEKLLGGNDGPGDAMKTAAEYISNVWLPEHSEEVQFYNTEQGWYKLEIDDVDYGCTNIEVYKNTSSDNPEMCYYIPLKDKQIVGKKVGN